MTKASPSARGPGAQHTRTGSPSVAGPHSSASTSGFEKVSLPHLAPTPSSRSEEGATIYELADSGAAQHCCSAANPVVASVP